MDTYASLAELPRLQEFLAAFQAKCLQTLPLPACLNYYAGKSPDK
jgi:hypothetical protein